MNGESAKKIYILTDNGYDHAFTTFKYFSKYIIGDYKIHGHNDKKLKKLIDLQVQNDKDEFLAYSVKVGYNVRLIPCNENPPK